MGNHVVIDVEMCRVRTVSGDYPCRNEIIQIGAVMLDEAFSIQDKFSTYVNPRFGRIDPFISKLTGITGRAVKDAPDIESALEQLLAWTGDKEVVFYSWSETDYYQLRKEIQLKCQENARWEKLLDSANWIDYQKVLCSRLESVKLLKLGEALELVELDIEGQLHDGLDDAYNTARMISRLEGDKDYRTPVEKLREKEESQKPLTVSLASFLEGIDLKTA